MGREWALAWASLGLALISVSASPPVQASGAALVPFAGESPQEFEARKKGIKLQKPGAELA
jgi:hypothetical protein